MPLSKPYADPTAAAVTLPGCYARIASVTLNDIVQTGQITLSVYRDEAACTAGAAPLATYQYALTPDGADGTISFPAWVSANQSAYIDLAGALYGTLLTISEWSSATIV